MDSTLQDRRADATAHATDGAPAQQAELQQRQRPNEAYAASACMPAWHVLPSIRTIRRRTELAENPSDHSPASSAASTCAYPTPFQLPSVSNPSTPGATSVRTFHASQASTRACTPKASHPAPGMFLMLPDGVLLHIWEYLDAASRRSLYHTCRAFWTNHGINSTLTTVSVNSLDDLLTWPRNAPSPTCLRLVNGPLDTPQKPWTQLSQWNDGDRNFLLLLEAAREHPRALDTLANVTHVALQGRGKGSELCKRLAWLLGPLCPRLSRLLVDWCSMTGETCASASCWLPSLTHLTLSAVNSVELRGSWPQPLLTYSDLAHLSALTRLELIDCHLPFLELGVQDITPLSALKQLQALHLVYADKEYEWPGSKPCYLMLGLGEVSKACVELEELVLDGVQLAKVVAPSWPALTTLAIGYISGWHPSLVSALDLDKSAPKLKQLTLGRIRCSGQSLEAKLLFGNRLTDAATSLSRCRVPPSHLSLSVPPTFTEHAPLSHLITALTPLSSHLTHLALETDHIKPGDVRPLADLRSLAALTLSLRQTCGQGLTDLLEGLPDLARVELQASEGNSDDSNALGLLYGAFSSVRRGPLTVCVRGASPYAAVCMQQMAQVKTLTGHTITLTCV